MAGKVATKPKATQEEILALGMPQIKKLYSELFDDGFEDRVSNDDFYPKFDTSEVQLGKVLGAGGFAVVHEIKGFSLSDSGPTHQRTNSNDNVDEEQVEEKYQRTTGNLQNDARQFQKVARTFLSRHCFRGVSSTASKKTWNKNSRYACKLLASTSSAVRQTAKKEDEAAQKYLQGILDIAIEARFLSTLQHRNIVKVKAMAQGSLFKPDYFLVLDRLYHTLEHRIYKVWSKKSQLQESIFGKMVTDRKGEQKYALWEERLIYAWDLSDAMTYLHERRILYRDLKPENVGFDCRDDIKLFDFGLSRPLKDHLQVTGDGSEDGSPPLYRLTNYTGSPRYMSPEVALGRPYNMTCDTYSFCIILWEMLALQRPFEVYTMTKLKQRVWGQEAKRPPLQESWSLPIRLLLQKGWTPGAKERLTMKQVENILEQECLRLTGGKDEMKLERRESDTSLVFQKQRAGKKTAHEVFREFSEKVGDDLPSPVGSVVSDDEDESPPDDLIVGVENSNVPKQELDWWDDWLDTDLEQIVSEALEVR